MKKFLLGIAVLPLVAFCSAAHAEEVMNSVYFNPSRLGNFQRLVVTDRVLSNGSVQTEEVSVLNSQLTLEGNKFDMYSLSMADRASLLDMPNAILGSTSAVMTVNGGKAHFTDASSIDTIDSQSPVMSLKVKSSMELSGLNIIGNGLRYNSTRNVPTTVKGLVLGGNDIPVPPTGSGKGCAGGNLVWQDVTVGDKQYKILGVTNCEQNTTECPANPNQERCCERTWSEKRTCTFWNGSRCIPYREHCASTSNPAVVKDSSGNCMCGAKPKYLKKTAVENSVCAKTRSTCSTSIEHLFTKEPQDAVACPFSATQMSTIVSEQGHAGAISMDGSGMLSTCSSASQSCSCTLGQEYYTASCYGPMAELGEKESTSFSYFFWYRLKVSYYQCEAEG